MQKRAFIGGACLAVALLVGGLSTQASAQTTRDRRTFFTFSGPIELPGVALPAGKYMFRIADPTGSRKVIQVVSEDGKRPFGMFFSQAIERAEAPREPEVRFMETAAGAPPAVKTIWYGGERSGLEFIYPREQALRLAKTASEPVLTTKAQTTTTEQTNTSETSRVSATGQEAEVAANRQPSAPTGRAQGGEVAPESVAVAPAPPARTNQTTQVARNEQTGAARTSLPRTASARPLVGLIGVGLLLAAAVLSMRRRAGV